jgi:hypothetical protein
MGEKAAAVNHTTAEERKVLFQSQDSSRREPHTSRERPQHPTANAVPQTPPTAASKGEPWLVHPHRQMKEGAAPQVTFTQQTGRKAAPIKTLKRSHSHTL